MNVWGGSGVSTELERCQRVDNIIGTFLFPADDNDISSKIDGLVP
jgi:hypothetical protein